MGKKAFKNSLLKHKVFALDTNCFIYHFEKHPVFSPLTEELFLLLKKKEAITSSITLSELISKKEIFADRKKLTNYKIAFLSTPSLRVVEVDLKVAEYAAGFRIIYNLRLPDAIQIATALLGGADVFITNDERMKKVEEIKVLLLKDFV